MELMKELAISQSPTQAKIVDKITRNAPILDSIPMEATSNGLQNVYEEVKGIDGAQFVSLGSELPSIGVDTELGYTDLSHLGGKMHGEREKVERLGGKDAYFGKQLPKILKHTAEQTDASIYYNNLRQFAITSGKAISAGGTDNTNYSMVVVTWEEGEMSGLYDPTKGTMFNQEDWYSGGLGPMDNGASGYTREIKAYLGIQLLNPRYISAIVNIDLTDDGSGDYTAFPALKDIRNILTDAEVNSNSRIYCHPRLKSAFGKYKADLLRVGVENKDLNQIVDMLDTVPIIPSYNLKDGTETNVTIS